MSAPAAAALWAQGAVHGTSLPVVAAQAQPSPPPGDPAANRGEEFGKTSPLALVVILLLGLATVLLIRSMNKRLRNVPASFDPTPADGAATDGAADGAADGRPTDRPAADEPPRAAPS